MELNSTNYSDLNDYTLTHIYSFLTPQELKVASLLDKRSHSITKQVSNSSLQETSKRRGEELLNHRPKKKQRDLKDSELNSEPLKDRSLRSIQAKLSPDRFDALLSMTRNLIKGSLHIKLLDLKTKKVLAWGQPVEQHSRLAIEITNFNQLVAMKIRTRLQNCQKDQVPFEEGHESAECLPPGETKTFGIFNTKLIDSPLKITSRATAIYQGQPFSLIESRVKKFIFVIPGALLESLPPLEELKGLRAIPNNSLLRPTILSKKSRTLETDSLSSSSQVPLTRPESIVNTTEEQLNMAIQLIDLKTKLPVEWGASLIDGSDIAIVVKNKQSFCLSFITHVFRSDGSQTFEGKTVQLDPDQVSEIGRFKARSEDSPIKLDFCVLAQDQNNANIKLAFRNQLFVNVN